MARRKKSDSTTTTTTRQREKGNFLSNEAMDALESGTYGQKYGRQATSFKSEDQARIGNPLPVLEGVIADTNSTPAWESSFSRKNYVDTDRARRNYAARLTNQEIPKSANDENYVVKRDRYDKLMKDTRLANDIKTLAMVNHNNANQDATVSQEWADEYGAKAITGGFSKSEYLKTLSRRYGLTPEELNDMALTFHTDANNRDVEQYGKQLEEIGKKHSHLGSAASLVGTLGSGFEGMYNTAVGAIGGDDRYLSNMFRSTKNSLREGVKSNMKTDVGKGAYDVFMGIGDLAAGAATGSAPTILAGNTANEALNSALERGTGVRKGAAYAGLAGAIDFVTNTIGLDEAKKMAVKSIKDAGIKQFLAKNAIAGLGEAGENIIQDISQSFIDQLINGKNSELQLAYNDKIANGMSESEAFKETALDYAKQLLLSAGIGFGMGSAMQAGTTVLPKVPELAANKWADIKMGKVGAVDPEIAKILASSMEEPDVPRPEIQSDSVNLQPNMGISEDNLQNPVNMRISEPQAPENLQTPMEKVPENRSVVEPEIEEIDGMIQDVAPETNTRNYSNEEIAEIQNYVEARDAIRAEMDKNVNMFDLGQMTKLNELRSQGKAMDAEMAEKYPELFNENGKFTGIPEQTPALDNSNQPRYNDGMTGWKTDNVDTTLFNPDYQGVDVEYSDSLPEPEKLIHAFTGKQVSPEFASALRRLESGQPITKEEYENIPEVREGMKKAGKGDTSEIDTEERKQKRDGWIDALENFGSAREVVDPATGKKNVVYDGPVDVGHRADIIIGSSGVGKSSVLVDPISNKYHSKLQDSDEAKKLIQPEYNDGWGAGLVHPESKMLIAESKIRTFAKGENVVIPIVGAKISNVKKEIDILRKWGYEVHVHLADLNENKAAGRNLRRYATQNRFINLVDTSFEYGDKPRKVYEQLKKEGLADGYTKVSNDVRMGELPVQLEGDENIPFDWRNNGQSRRTGITDIGEENGGNVGEEIRQQNPDIENVTGTGPIEQPSEVAFSNPENTQGGVNNGEPLRTIPPRSDKTGESAVVTNSAINADIISRYDYDNDAQLQDIARYAKANNELTYDSALKNVQKNGAKLLDEYNTDQRVIDNDQDVDQAMLLLRNLKNQIQNASPEEAEFLTTQRNMLLSRLRKAGTKYGQTIQAFAKWNDTADGAISNGESMNAERAKVWESRNQEQVERNNEIADELDQITRPRRPRRNSASGTDTTEIPEDNVKTEKPNTRTNAYMDRALRMQGNDGTVEEAARTPKTHEQIREEVVNSLNRELGSIAKNLTDTDYDYYTNLVEEHVPLETIVDEIEHRLNHGEFYTIDESIEEPKQLHSKLLSALNSLVDTEEVNPRQELSMDELREQVRNTLERESASIGEFTDDDVDYLANLIQNGANKEELAQALNTKMATGRFGVSADTQRKVNLLFEYADHYDPNSKEACEAKAAAYKLIAEEVVGDASPFEKFEAWRYLAMLGNPKTMLRNFVGNTMFNAVTSLSNGLSAIAEAGIDKTSRALGGKGIQRTKAILSPTKDANLIKGAWEDAPSHRYKQLQGAKYEKSGVRDKIAAEKSVFNSKFLQLYEKATDKGISDYPAIRTKYSTSLAGWMKANGLDEKAFDAEPYYKNLQKESQVRLLSDAEKAKMAEYKQTMDALEKGREYALKQAEYATFHEDNDVASAISEFARKNINSQNKGRRALGYMMEGIIPFKKTPANILRSGWEYSPMGALNSIAKTGKLIYENTGKRKNNLGDTYTKQSWWRGDEKEINRTLASDVIESWSKTLTGTGLAYLGYYLMDKGILNSSDKDQKYQDELEGIQNYSITINGKTYTLDWAAPAVMPLLLGAEAKKIFEQTGTPDEKWYKNPDKIIGSINSLLNPVFETSMLQGIQNVLESASNEIKYNEDNSAVGGILGAATTNALTGYASQAVPTILGQVARTIDNTRRTTDTASDSNFLAGVEKQGRKMMNKIPGLSFLNPEYIDAYGNTQTSSPYDNPLGNLAYQMLSPAYVRDINTTDADIMARNAYNAPDSAGVPVMNKDVFAPWKGKVTYGGEKLDPQQLHDYREKSGKASYEIRDALAHEEWFKNLDGEEQTTILKKVNSLVNKVGLEAAGYEQSSKELDAYKTSVPELMNTLKGTAVNKMATEAGLSTSSKVVKEAQAAMIAGNEAAAKELINKGGQAKEKALSLGFVNEDGNVDTGAYNKAVATVGEDELKLNYYKQYQNQDFPNGTNDKVPYVMQSNLSNEEKAKLITSQTDPSQLKGAGITGAYDKGGWDGVWYWRYLQYLADKQFGDGNGSVKKAEKDDMLAAINDPRNQYYIAELSNELRQYFQNVPNKQW